MESGSTHHFDPAGQNNLEGDQVQKDLLMNTFYRTASMGMSEVINKFG